MVKKSYIFLLLFVLFFASECMTHYIIDLEAQRNEAISKDLNILNTRQEGNGSKGLTCIF